MSEFEELQKKRRELLDVHKHKNDVPEKTLYDSDPSQQVQLKTFRDKWKNYWYHYTGRTIVLTICGVLVLAMAWSTIFPQKYDVSISIAVQNISSDNAVAQNAFFSEMAKDYDKNGKTNAEVNYYTFTTTTANGRVDTQQVMISQSKLAANLSDGEYFLYLVDDTGYQVLKSQGCTFVDLSSWSDSANIKKDKYYLTGTTLAKKLGLNKDADKDYLCLLNIKAYPSEKQKKKKVAEAFSRQSDYLKRLLAIG